MKKFIVLLFSVFLISSPLFWRGGGGEAFSQDIPIGAWRSFLPYNHPIAVADAGDKVYCANASSIFSYQKDNGLIQRFSKINGLSEIDISTIAYSLQYKILIVAYQSSNIDLITENEIINISDLKRANLTGDKTIYHIDLFGNFAYLSCGFGIVVLDILKNEIKDTYYIGANGSNVKVNAVSKNANKIFAATENGLYVALSNSNLLNFASWNLQGTNEGLPSVNCFSTVFFKNKIYASVADTLFIFDGNNKWNYFYSEMNYQFLGISASATHLVVTIDSIQFDPIEPKWFYTGFLRKIILIDENKNSQKANNGYTYRGTECVEDNAGAIWIPDIWLGFGKNYNGQLYFITPNGPPSNSVTQMEILNNELWVTPGGNIADWSYRGSGEGFFSFINDEWKSYNNVNYPVFDDSLKDIISVAVNPANQKIFFASLGSAGGGGVVEYDKNADKIQIYKFNSTLEKQPDAGSFWITGLTFDKDNNLWVVNRGVSNPISVKKANGGWKAFNIGPYPPQKNHLSQILVDKNNQKWILSQDPLGIFVYNHGEDIDNTNDDKYKLLINEVGKGNLPSSSVLSIIEDLGGEIWIGTTKGIAVFYCSEEIFSEQGCDAQQILVLQDNYYGYLLENEEVQAIAIDGANRKWIGTGKNGVWLMSADGTNEILHFNENNSPLLSNDIKHIAINQESGEVFFGTEKGICSFRSDATLGGEKHENVFVFPNPVRQYYQGTIAIKGLVQNAFIKITDINGALVYQTKALGGQAVWDGKNYKGEKPKTGIYLVFSSNEDGSEKLVTKFLIAN